MLETQERPSPESSIITIKNSKPAGKGEPSGICDGSFGSKSGPSPPNSCLLCLVSWLSSFFAINPQSNAYTLMIPVVAQGFHGEKPLFLSLHILCKVFCTRRLVRTCNSSATATPAPAARLHPQHPRPQRSRPWFTRPRLLQVLRRKDVVPERAKLLDELNVRGKPLHFKQLVLGKPSKLRVNLWVRNWLFRLTQRADITIHM